MAQTPVAEHDEPESEPPAERPRVFSYRSNPQVTMEWRRVKWSKEQRLELARILLKEPPRSEGPPVR
ncbi:MULTISPECIES: hypothetical protein [unclassified Streptomyces]|uniref:hypothetical protein n=1 Tax=unclassified Streptomyces TaxID=2593676 RepID=UPI0033210F52